MQYKHKLGQKMARTTARLKLVIGALYLVAIAILINAFTIPVVGV